MYYCDGVVTAEDEEEEVSRLSGKVSFILLAKFFKLGRSPFIFLKNKGVNKYYIN